MNLACLAVRAAAILLGATVYHLKGLGLKEGASPLGSGPALPGGREICLALCGIAAAYALWAFDGSFHWWVYALVALGTALADCLPHSEGMIFGSTTGTTWKAFFVLLSTGAISGAATVILLGLDRQFVAAAIALVAFSLKPLAYFIGWKIPSTVHDFESGPPLGECLHGASRLAWPLVAAGVALSVCPV